MKSSIVKPSPQPKARRSPGIRAKMAAFLIPLVILLIVAMSAAVVTVTDRSVRRDLLQRGVAAARIVALSARWSLLSGDNAAIYNLAVETRRSSPDIDYVAVTGLDHRIIAHNDPRELGRLLPPSVRVAPLGTFEETRANDVIHAGRPMIEFTTTILYRGGTIGLVSIGFSKAHLAEAQRDVRRSITFAALGILVIALTGTFLFASFITTPVKKLTSGVKELSEGEGFRPIPVAWDDELGDLTHNFNRMAGTILTQQESLTHYAKRLEDAYVGMVRVVAASIEARDPYTIGHSTRVARLSIELGKRMGMGEEELVHLEKAALFHDVGKISTPDDVLLKEERLSVGEMDVMRQHPDEGADILGKAPFLERYVPVVRTHHEWYDGTGYPNGLKGDEIPLHAQIIAIADAYDAMTTTRPYRQALTFEESIESIIDFRGTQFAPELTDEFVKMMREAPPTMEDTDWRGMAL